MEFLRNDTLKALDALVETGDFASADEAVMAAIEAWHQRREDALLHLNALDARIHRSLSDPRPSLTLEEVDAALDLLMQDPTTGEVVVVYGAGALKDSPLDLREDVDLTKPIAEQVFKPIG
ncbi:hypothetical protein [Rhizobium rhizophilum]|uniref:Type II toxin-antitoxin system ParD family antitoxin n=1 Tax=Rhizobium rhizophilum TaxID=1850373 RepID=A0ABY2QWE0_9HYPH|nr:hypothetical protein [Rhizobium rhizophilum]THV15268.1 hypothetical protein E9677_07880 [Rhizobium rhizophilum]